MARGMPGAHYHRFTKISAVKRRCEKCGEVQTKVKNRWETTKVGKSGTATRNKRSNDRKPKHGHWFYR